MSLLVLCDFSFYSNETLLTTKKYPWPWCVRVIVSVHGGGDGLATHKRVWTLQEACLNQNTYIVASVRDAPIIGIFLGRHFRQDISIDEGRIFIHIDDFVRLIIKSDYDQYGRAVVVQAYAFQHIREIMKTQGPVCNLVGLNMLANRKYTHEKDKVFGVMGMASIHITKENCTEIISLKDAIKTMLRSLNGKEVIGALGLCNMTTATWIYYTIMRKHAQNYSWIRGF
jgi:hypothetical protein